MDVVEGGKSRMRMRMRMMQKMTQDEAASAAQ